MKKFTLVIAILLCGFNTAFTQSTTFDTSFILISSDVYDYKNPTFENYFWPFDMKSTDRLAYEVHSASGSDMVIKKYTFNSDDSAVTIISDGYKNINSSFSNNMIVWQSNKFGKQDLFYSMYNGTSWSAPLAIDSSEGDKLQPNVHFSGYLDIYCLSYEKNADIFFRYYRGGLWSNDTNLTSLITQECHSPVLLGNGYNLSIMFIRDNTDTTNEIVKQPLQVDFPLYEIIFGAQSEIYHGKLIKNIRLSTGPGEQYINFEKDSSTNTDIYGYRLSFGNQLLNFTSEYEGKCYSGRGSFGAMIFDNSNLYNYFFCFGFIRKTTDTTNVVVYRTKNGSNLISNEFYLGDSTVQSYCNISRPVRSSYVDFKIRLIWEQVVNGKIALVESDLIDRIVSVSNEPATVKSFNLSQNYPNPFNPNTIIIYSIPSNVKRQTSNVKLSVYDPLGKEVAIIVNEKQNAGSYEAEFNGNGLPSGVYFYKLEAGDFVETKRMILLK